MTTRTRRGSISSAPDEDTQVNPDVPAGIDVGVPDAVVPVTTTRRRRGGMSALPEDHEESAVPDAPTSTIVHQDVEIWDIQVRKKITNNTFANGFYAVVGYCPQKSMTIKVTGTCEGMDIAEGNNLQIIPDMNTLQEEVYNGNVQTVVHAVMTNVMPNHKNPREIAKWLEGFHGIGPVRAKAICDVLCAHGRNPFETLEQPDVMIREGVSESDANEICRKYQASRIEQRAMIYLMSLADGNGKHYLDKRQINNVLKSRMFDLKNIRNEIETNPWALTEIDGIGFKTADTLACEFFDHGTVDKRRVHAGLLYALTKVGEKEGHCGLQRDELVRAASDSDVLDISVDRVYDVLDEMLAHEDLVTILIKDRKGNEHDLIMRPDMNKIENYIVDRLVGILKRGPNMSPEVAGELADRFSAMSGVDLDPTQKRAVCMALVYGVGVITGGPGTGKSTVQDIIFSAREYYEKTRETPARDYSDSEDDSFTISPTCPTGKGAARLAEATNRPAMTVHRWLKWNPKEGGFGFNEENPHPADEVTVDEISMGGVATCYHQLAALRKDTGGIKYVGDDRQLPSVDRGNFLADIIDSGLIPVAQLDATHRQAKNSGIPIVSKRILHGVYPFEEGEKLRGVKHVNIEGSMSLHEIIDIVVRQCVEMGCSPDTDISIMSPIHKTALGDVCVNAILKEMVNPVTEDDRTEEIVKNRRVLDDGSPDETSSRRRRSNKSDSEMAKFTFTLGDVVMNTKNDMRMGFMNGETGSVRGFKSVFARNSKGEELDYKLRTILVEVDGRTIAYDPQKLECIPYAEAKTIHKEQGSQSSIAVVILPEGESNTSKQSLYTALTRGETFSFIVGSAESLMRAVNNNGPDRQTGLAFKLSQKIDEVRSLYQEKGWDCSFLEENQKIIDRRIAYTEEVTARAMRGLRAPEWARAQTREMTEQVRRRLQASSGSISPTQAQRRRPPSGIIPGVGRVIPVATPAPASTQPIAAQRDASNTHSTSISHPTATASQTPVRTEARPVPSTDGVAAPIEVSPASSSAGVMPVRRVQRRRVPPGIAMPLAAAPLTSVEKPAGGCVENQAASEIQPEREGVSTSKPDATPLTPPVRHVITTPKEANTEQDAAKCGVEPLESSASRRINIRRRVIPNIARQPSPSP